MESTSISDYIFNYNEYIDYVVQYEGSLNEFVKGEGEIYLRKINNEYAILIIKEDLIDDSNDIFKINEIIEGKIPNEVKITYITPPHQYTLQSNSAIEAAGVEFLQLGAPINLTGKGVNIAIVDTGIDYLNTEFMKEDGSTRIKLIWDQTIDKRNTKYPEIKYGYLFDEEEINTAITLKKSGGDPYTLVNSKDEIGHGTNMAGILGARGVNPDLKGVAPQCNFIVVKLIEDLYFKSRNNSTKPVYNITSIFSALDMLNNYQIRTGEPLVILLPLGTNFGRHNGYQILNSYIETISANIGVAVVTGTGNEGVSNTHSSGIINNVEDIERIEMLVSKEQKNLRLDIWVDVPSIVDLNLISPSGEESGFIQAVINKNKAYSSIFEKSKITIQYFMPEQFTGSQLIRVDFRDITEGSWGIRLKLRQGKNTKFDAWIWQKDLLVGDTRLNPSEYYGTMTVPGDSDQLITVAAYNQTNSNLLPYSGAAFKDNYYQRIDFAAGGVNTQTVGLNGTIDVISGTSLAAAVGAGIAALMFQWGIIDKNFPYMYTQSLKTFLQRGATKRGNEEYPDAILGYGIINLYKVFENIM